MRCDRPRADPGCCSLDTCDAAETPTSLHGSVRGKGRGSPLLASPQPTPASGAPACGVKGKPSRLNGGKKGEGGAPRGGDVVLPLHPPAAASALPLPPPPPWPPASGAADASLPAARDVSCSITRHHVRTCNCCVGLPKKLSMRVVEHIWTLPRASRFRRRPPLPPSDPPGGSVGSGSARQYASGRTTSHCE